MGALIARIFLLQLDDGMEPDESTLLNALTAAKGSNRAKGFRLSQVPNNAPSARNRKSRRPPPHSISIQASGPEPRSRCQLLIRPSLSDLFLPYVPIQPAHPASTLQLSRYTMNEAFVGRRFESSSHDLRESCADPEAARAVTSKGRFADGHRVSRKYWRVEGDSAACW